MPTIKINSDQIEAKCMRRRYSNNVGALIHLQKEFAETDSLPLSYEAALMIWDHIRVKRNKITFLNPHTGNWFVIQLTIPLLSVIGIAKHGKGFEVSHGNKRIRFYFERKDLVDPFILETRQKPKELIVDILDDIINRLEPLKTHDTENFKWVGNQIQLLKR